MDNKCLFFFLKTTDDMLLLFAESGDQKLLEKQGLGFFGLKIHFQFIFDPKHLENTLNILISLSMASKNKKKSSKNRS
jgi:hypothetical protein